MICLVSYHQNVSSHVEVREREIRLHVCVSSLNCLYVPFSWFSPTCCDSCRPPTLIYLCWSCQSYFSSSSFLISRSPFLCDNNNVIILCCIGIKCTFEFCMYMKFSHFFICTLCLSYSNTYIFQQIRDIIFALWTTEYRSKISEQLDKH